ncbi:glycosyltransferase [Salinimicrobium sp. HB62]|uniref:glycosyltransferase n=1 Tax=Salinimicrobium sp. HB62 TaxID=3077781 RepID=UPI002D79EACA|nr:glycosyltransferase [Salinimicrobium sp. HB62]
MERKRTVSGKSSQRLEKDKSLTPVRDYEMLVFCHLRWGFVYQRPQHLISRLCKSYKVLFIEEPIAFAEENEGGYELEVINSNLHILKPRARNVAGISAILKKYLSRRKFSIGWFYSAAFSEVLGDFDFGRVIYDCMDELSLFRGANPELVRQEKFLLSEAEIVFTGGKSLYEAKSKVHFNVHCFPSSVERYHFAVALNELPLPQDMNNIKKPVVGYFGVIDERINLKLLQEVAKARPDISFVMIGPLAKIGEEDLPREKNIYYLGMKAYKDLPAYLAGFDVAMMPFALNDATRFISPTKTLEYMAAGKPIISTAIKDVERDYRHCISIVGNAEEFSGAIDRMLGEDGTKVLKSYKEILNHTSWDHTATQMEQLISTEVKV